MEQKRLGDKITREQYLKCMENSMEFSDNIASDLEYILKEEKNENHLQVFNDIIDKHVIIKDFKVYQPNGSVSTGKYYITTRNINEKLYKSIQSYASKLKRVKDKDEDKKNKNLQSRLDNVKNNFELEK